MVVAVYSTTGNIDEARKIARILVKEKLAACVNIIPTIESIYSWKGKIEEVSECVIIAKTTKKILMILWKRLNKFIHMMFQILLSFLLLLD